MSYSLITRHAITARTLALLGNLTLGTLTLGSLPLTSPLSAQSPAPLLPAEGRPVAAEHGSAQPVELSPGPLLTFLTNTGENPHHTHLFVANADGDEPAKMFWDNVGNARTIARLDQSHLLVASYGPCYGLIAVDTKAATNTLLCTGSFVAVHGDNILYLGDNRWSRGDNHLYTRSWRKPGEPRKLAEARFQSVPIVSGNLAIAVADGGRQIWSVSIVSGRARKLLELPENATGVRLVLSPGGQRLAVGACILSRGQLTVVDLGSGKVLRQWRELNVDVSLLSSSMPTVEPGWRDDQHVVTSETIGSARKGGNFAWVTRSLETGKVTEEVAYAPMELYHRTPPTPRPSSAPEPVFSIAHEAGRRQLLQVGKAEPVQSVPLRGRRGAAIQLSPDRQFAIVRPEHNPRLGTLYRANRPALAVLHDGGSEFRWFAATKPAPGAAAGNQP